MTTNKTSQAIDTFEACDIDGLGRLTPDDLRAIRQKFKRMEEALQEIVHDRHVWPEQRKDYERKDMMDIAEEALSFDPLR